MRPYSQQAGSPPSRWQSLRFSSSSSAGASSSAQAPVEVLAGARGDPEVRPQALDLAQAVGARLVEVDPDDRAGADGALARLGALARQRRREHLLAPPSRRRGEPAERVRVASLEVAGGVAARAHPQAAVAGAAGAHHLDEAVLALVDEPRVPARPGRPARAARAGPSRPGRPAAPGAASPPGRGARCALMPPAAARPPPGRQPLPSSAPVPRRAGAGPLRAAAG